MTDDNQIWLLTNAFMAGTHLVENLQLLRNARHKSHYNGIWYVAQIGEILFWFQRINGANSFARFLSAIWVKRFCHWIICELCNVCFQAHTHPLSVCSLASSALLREYSIKIHPKRTKKRYILMKGKQKRQNVEPIEKMWFQNHWKVCFFSIRTMWFLHSIN